uniref:Uncharacterized protein n=1 Tax=Globisporangium ultimum (strain ATCC 200006 / CBS 805.95 / DAOM BR144) TaxID=431595 RepID=K3X4Q1_GLOUD
MDATQSVEGAPSERLHEALVLLLRSWREDDRMATAQRWVDAIHAAFYAPTTQRGASMSKFQELEVVLTRVFGTLRQHHDEGCDGEDAVQLLWTCMVDVVLLLAQEQPPPPAAGHDGRSDNAAQNDSAKQHTKKANKKRVQPYTPLAFVVLCALKKFASQQESGDAGGATSSATVRVKSNAALTAFCQRGLEIPEAVDQKLLVEILDLFQLTHFDAALVLAACDRHVRTKSYSAAVKLCTLCRHVEWPFADIVKSMAQAKDWVSAELLVRNCERSNETTLAKLLIDEAIALREFKRVHRLVEAFNLSQDYLDL